MSAPVLAYLRVSTKAQGDSGAGLAAQRRAILAAAEARGWPESSIEWVEEVAGAGRRKRPHLEDALARLAAGRASVLVADKLDRVARSLLGFLTICEKAQQEGWELVVLNAPVEVGTPAGKMVLSVLGAFAELEKGLISARTTAALAEKREQGVRLGRPLSLDPLVRARIKYEHGQGESITAIARRLNAEQVPTAQGGTWWPATVKKIALA
jgi:DNA invertase Pin-like site-specific DNA recombinase